MTSSSEEADDEMDNFDRICDVFFDLVGEFGGVQFDLRHKLLPPGVCECPLPLSVSDTVTEPDLPLIWYPWFKDEATSTNEDKKRKRNLKSGVRSLTIEHNECVVEVGDKVVIDRVEEKATGNTFEHEHDSVIVLAFLKVVSKDGTCKFVQSPIVFRGSSSIISANNEVGTISKICSRICDHFWISSLSSKKKIEKDASYSYRALEQARKLDALIRSDFQPLRAGYVEDAALLGFLWAKAEAEINLKPLAQKALQRKDYNKAGGAASGAARRKKAEQGWIPVVRELVTAIRNESPDLSQDDVVYAIQDRWEAKKQNLLHNALPDDRERIKKLELRKHARLKQLISAMEKAGDIPRRQAGEQEEMAKRKAA